MPTSHQASPVDSLFQRSLSDLREGITRGDGSSELLDHLDGVERGWRALRADQDGLADELLGVYEQLGIVFSVTKELPRLKDEHAVLRVLHGNLERSLAGYHVGLYTGSGRDARGVLGRSVDVSQMADLMQQACERRCAAVHRIDGAESGLVELLVSPVIAGDVVVGVIVIARPAEVRALRASDMSVIESLSHFCGDLIRNYRLLRELRTMSVSMVRSLVNAVDQKDKYTAGHSTRVAYFATMLGSEIGVAGRDHRMLQWSALLHDVGKIGIRDDVLKKDGALTEEEFEHMKEHPVRSYEVVKGVPHLAGALDGVLYHHEHFDGKGYPKGLKGVAIPLQARVIQIADVFDALTSTRTYRRAFDWTKALAIMSDESGTTLDPNLQATFDRMLRAVLNDGSLTWERLLDQANTFTHVWEDAAPGEAG
ncbi:MAG: HD-GYP domain-containing protein [Phycisphaerae bacterium]